MLSPENRCSRCKGDLRDDCKETPCTCSTFHPRAGAPTPKAHSIYEGFEWEGNYSTTKADKV